jgi:putative tryptophan/tyrosine transport system substrate-binding protein
MFDLTRRGFATLLGGAAAAWPLVARAQQSAMPVIGFLGAVEVGGLMSYGANLAESLQQVGVYTGRILKGAKPADLPVMQSTKLELVINAESARMLGLVAPPNVLSIADEVIE